MGRLSRALELFEADRPPGCMTVCHSARRCACCRYGYCRGCRRRGRRDWLGGDRRRSVACTDSERIAHPDGLSGRSRTFVPGAGCGPISWSDAMAPSARRLRLGACLADDMGLARPFRFYRCCCIEGPGPAEAPALFCCGASLPTRQLGPKRFLASRQPQGFSSASSATPAEKLTNGGSDSWSTWIWLLRATAS